VNWIEGKRPTIRGSAGRPPELRARVLEAVANELQVGRNHRADRCYLRCLRQVW